MTSCSQAQPSESDLGVEMARRAAGLLLTSECPTSARREHCGQRPVWTPRGHAQGRAAGPAAPEPPGQLEIRPGCPGSGAAPRRGGSAGAAVPAEPALPGGRGLSVAPRCTPVLRAQSGAHQVHPETLRAPCPRGGAARCGLCSLACIHSANVFNICCAVRISLFLHTQRGKFSIHLRNDSIKTLKID